MPAYPYKVRVLAAIDSNFSPRNPSQPIPLSAIESAFEAVCEENDIVIPGTWKKRAHLTLNELTSDGWLLKNVRDNTYTPSPTLRRIVAEEKSELNVATSNHDIKTFVAVAKMLKSSTANNDEVGSAPAATPVRTPTASARVRRKSTRFSLPAPQSQQRDLREEEEEEEEQQQHGASLPETIVVQGTPPPKSHRKKSRQSDPGPHVVASASRRRSFGGAAPRSSSQNATPASHRKRSKPSKRRHTLAVVPAPAPARTPTSMSMPSGVSREVQFFPLKQALSRRTIRALRRNALSEEMNNIQAEESAARRKQREELMKLRAELSSSQRRLQDLEQALLDAKNAPETEHLDAVREDSEHADVDMGVGFGMDYDDSMDMGVDHADDTPAHTPEPEARISPALATTPARLSRQPSSNGGVTTPLTNRDLQIRDLEEQIASLREDIKRRTEEARRWQEEAEEFQEFHDAEEQILVEENRGLYSQLEELRSPPPRRVAFDETTMVEEEVEIETVVEGSVFNEGMSVRSIATGTGYDASSVGGELMDIEEEEEEEESQPDPRIADLQADNEKLQSALETLSRKIHDLEEEAETDLANSEDLRRQANAFQDENDKLRALSERLAARITQLEELEGVRLENVFSGAVQTDEFIDEEKEEMEFKVDELAAEVDELKSMHSTVVHEKRELEVALAECKAAIKGLEHSVEVGTKDKADADALIEDLRQHIGKLEKRLGEEGELEQELEGELSSSRQQIQALTGEIERLRHENVAWQEKVADKDRAIEDLSEQLRGLTVRVSDFDSQVNNLKDELRLAKEQLDEKDEEIETLEVERGKLRADLEDREDQIEDLKLENSKLEVDIDQLETTLDVKDKKILGLDEINDALKNANERLQSDKSQLEAVIADLQAASDVSDEATKELRAKIAYQEAAISELRAAAEAADKTKQEFEKAITGLQTRISTLEKAADISNADKDSLERDIGQLEIRIAELKADLKTATGDKESLSAKLAESNAQIEMFQQAAAAAALEKESMERQIAELHAEVEASKKAIRVVQGEKADLDEQSADLKESIVSLEDEIEALQAEKSLMRQEIDDYKSRVANLEQVIEIAQKDNTSLRETIKGLEDKAASLEESLRDSTSANTKYLQELTILREKIESHVRQAKTVEDEQSIIVQKIQQYIDGSQPLDMAVDEVLTELVMAKNHAEESEGLRRQLEDKIRILAQDGDGRITPEEAIEKLTDRFKDVRKRIENLYNRRRQLQDSHFANHNLEDFAWTGSNDHALQVLGALISELDAKLLIAKDNATALQSDLDAERRHAVDLDGFLDDIATYVNGESVKKEDLPAFVEKYVLAVAKQINSLEDKLQELEEDINDKNATIRNLEARLEDMEVQKSSVDKELIDVKADGDATRERLSDAAQQIAELNAAAQEDRMQIDELEQEINVRKSAEEELRQRLEEQAASHREELQKAHHEKMVAVAGVENKLAEAVLGKNHLESQLATTIEEHASQISSLEGVVAGSKDQVQELHERIAQLKSSQKIEVDELTIRISKADGKIADLEQELRETEARKDTEIAALEVDLENAQEEKEALVHEYETKLAEANALAKKLDAQLGERIAEIEGLAIEIEELKRHNASQKKIMEARIQDLERELQNALFNAGKEKIRLEQIIQHHEERIGGLEREVSDYKNWLDDAEEKEAELEESLKLEESEHQLYVEEVNRNIASLRSQKEQVQAYLEVSENELARTKSELEADNAALRKLVDEKKQQIEQLRVEITVHENDKRKLELQVVHLEKEKHELEQDLETEREKGMEAFERVQQEAERFYSRIGDHKGQYMRELKLRESKKRVHSDVSASSSQEVEYPKRPLSPVSNKSRFASGAFRTKKRRLGLYGDSGIGVDVEEDDEGFEGSVATSMLT